MARKRMIDPGIWQSEDFSKLSTLAKLVFIGLFSLADDEGRGRSNPVYLKSTLFPYEEGIRSADIDKTLSEISSNMSVIFYTCDGSSYYSLYNWNTWQKIDRPSESKIPNYNKEIMQLLFDDNSTNARRVVAPNKNRIEDNKNIKEKEEKRNRIVETYNSICTNLPQIQKLTDKRKKAIDNFTKEFTEEQFKEICNIANNSEFLTGNNDRGWKADFDFLMRTDKATAILEGKYSNNKNSGMDDFKKMWEEAKQDEQNGNNTSNNTFGW
nr:MAG TPA_asm: replisome organizer [Bacteriophage sp.]